MLFFDSFAGQQEKPQVYPIVINTRQLEVLLLELQIVQYFYKYKTHTQTKTCKRYHVKLINDNRSLSSTRTCLFTAANDTSHKCSTGTYRETPIVPTSCTIDTQQGQSRGTWGGEGTEGTQCTLGSNTPVLTPDRREKE